MHYDPRFEDLYVAQYEAEERHEREAELHQAIHDRLLRLNEEELKQVLQFVRMVYRNCEERQMYIKAGYPQWNLE